MSMKLTANEIWSQEIRPFILDDLFKTYKTDDVLIEKLTDLVNHVDGDIRDNRNILERIEPFAKVLNLDSYYQNSALRRATETERAKVRELASMLSMLQTVAKTEAKFKQRQKVEEVVEAPKSQRFPNREFDVRDLYKPTEEN